MFREKQRRIITVVDDGQLSEVQKEEMVNDYDSAQAFIQEKISMVQTSDALVDRLAELEDRHQVCNVWNIECFCETVNGYTKQGMLKIEKSIKELQEMWMD